MRRRVLLRRAVLAAALMVGAVAFSAAAGVAQADTLEDLLEFDAAVAALGEVDPELYPPPNDRGKDIVVGGFKASAFPDWNNGYSAHSGPNGEDPAGRVSAIQPDLGWKLRMEVVCVAVYGNLAVVGIVGTFRTPGDEFAYSELDVLRDGGPGGAMDGFDAFVDDPFDCHNPIWVPFALSAPPLDNGNILIHDAG